MPKYEKNYFKFNERYGRVLYLENYPQYRKDKFVAVICGLNKNLVYSMDILTIPTDEAVKEAENKLLGVEYQYSPTGSNGKMPTTTSLPLFPYGHGKPAQRM